MFKSFLKKVSTGVQTLVEPSKDMSEVIAEIHNEFNIGGEKALKEAKEIIAGIKITNEEKAKRLKGVGFSNVAEVGHYDRLTKKKEMQESIAKAITDLSIKYPQYKFITTEMANSICSKYGLVVGDISQYKGFVPEKNLKQIESFYIQDNELSNFYFYRYSSRWSGTYEISKEYYEQEMELLKRMRETNSENYIQYSQHKYTSHSRRSLQIAAPKKDMKEEGYKLVGNFFEKEIPDPVILAPLKYNEIELYCIVTAWGDEASDEIVVNEKMN